MTDGDLLREAVAELYSSDPASFVGRRGVLAARARAAGQASVARSIAALRKPTRSAWVVNQLIRSDPGVTSQLAGLGGELRAAQGSLDGAAVRELSMRRRQLIAELSRRAFAVSGLPSPPAALRDEVTATLAAALADPQVAGQLAAGALERPARADGFGPAGAPALALAPPRGARRALARSQAVTRAGARAGPAGKATAARQEARAAAAARAEAAAAERSRRRRAALEEAEQAVAGAGQAAAEAAAAELDRASAVQRLEEELADARQALTTARVRARRARSRERQARQARDRLRAARVTGAPEADPRA